MTAKPLDLEAEPREEIAVRVERVAVRGAEVHREREEQPLRRRLAALEHAHELLVEHALVRRVLVDEHDAVVALEHHVRAAELHERRDEQYFFLRARRRGGCRCHVGHEQPALPRCPPSGRFLHRRPAVN